MTKTIITNYGKKYNNPTCPNCGSANLSESVGKNLQELKRLRRQALLTPCLELLESQGVSGDLAIFLLSLSQVGDSL